MLYRVLPLLIVMSSCLLLPTVSLAEFEVRSTNGNVMTWNSYYEEGDSYCRPLSSGAFCVPKSSVVSIKEVRETGPQADRVIMSRGRSKDEIARDNQDVVNRRDREIMEDRAAAYYQEQGEAAKQQKFEQNQQLEKIRQLEQEAIRDKEATIRERTTLHNSRLREINQSQREVDKIKRDVELDDAYRRAGMSDVREEQKNREAAEEAERAARSRAANAAMTKQNPGAIDIKTGEYYPGAAGGIINPRTSEFYPESGGGYINPRTGEFMPKQ